MTDTELIVAAERAERWTGCIKCAAKDASVDCLEGEVQSLQAKLSDATALAYNLDPDRTDPNVRSLCEQISHLGEHIAEYKDLIDDYAVRHGEMTRKVDRMVSVASDLLEFAEEGWAYADDYFRRKWYYERVIELLAALDKLKEG